jgi:hypothetical protein
VFYTFISTLYPRRLSQLQPSFPSNILGVLVLELIKSVPLNFIQELDFPSLSATTSISFANGFIVQCQVWSSIFMHSFYTFLILFIMTNVFHCILNLQPFPYRPTHIPLVVQFYKSQQCCLQTLVLFLTHQMSLTCLSVAFPVNE